MALEAVGAASAIAALAELTIKVMGHIKDVRDADKQIEDYNREASSLVTLLTSLRARIMQNGAKTGDPWFDSVRMLQHGPMQQYQTALEAFALKVAPRPGRRGKIFHRMLWVFNKRDVQDLVAKMERLKTLISVALQMDHFKLSQGIGDSVENVQADTNAIRATGENIEVDIAAIKTDSRAQAAISLDILQDTSQISGLRSEVVSRNEAERKADEIQRKMAVMEWLSDQDYAEQQHNNISRYSEGTGMWLLEHPDFRRWKEGICDSLFCVGMPGAGKTVMSAMVIRHMIQSFRSSDMRVAVAFLYLRYDRRDNQSTEKLLGSLIRQLVSQAPKTPISIENAFDEHSISGDSPNQKMLLAAVECFERVHFVVDALDEGAELATRELVATIRALPDEVKLFATSRFDSVIQAQFRDDPHIEIRGSNRDIRHYTKSRLSELPSCVENNSDLQLQIIHAITTSTEGMFLLAKLNMDSLKGKRSVKAIKMMLEKLPSGSDAYDAAYDLAMDRIADQSDDDRRLARTVLTWVTHALQPLTEVDLETALAVELGQWKLDPDNIVPTVDLLSLCAGLVAMDESKTIHLAHYTAQEYLERNPHHLLNNPHLILAEVCLSYMGIDDFMTSGFVDDVDRPHLSSHAAQHPFLGYAAAHWEDHKARDPSTEENEINSRIMPLILRLYRHNELMHSYFRARGRWEALQEIPRVMPVERFTFESKTGLQYAAGRGSCELVSALLELGVDVNEETYGTTALIEAAQSLHGPVVRLLLDSKADVHQQSQNHQTALTAALGMHTKRSQYKNTLVYLVHDDDPSVQETRESIVDLLLNAGSDPDHTTNKYRNTTALMSAVECGPEWVVSKLCYAGADVGWRDNDGTTAIRLAAVQGHERVFETLLRFGSSSEIYIGSNQWIAAIEIAARNGHESIVRQLLLHLGDSCLKEATSAAAIHPAAFYGHAPIVELLLVNGVDPNLKEKWSGATALHLAAGRGHTSTISILLAHGSDQGIQDHKCRTALDAAAENGHEDVVEQLLRHDCDPGSVGGSNTPFRTATEASSTTSDVLSDPEEHPEEHPEEGFQEDPEVDSERDSDEDSEETDVDLDTECGPTALRLTYMTKPYSDSIPELLTELRPQHIGGLDEYFWAGFMHKIRSQNAAVVLELLVAGPDVTLAVKNGYTAFHVLAAVEWLEDPVISMMRMLLKAAVPVDVDIRASDGGTPLMFAACAGHSQRVKFLLDEGADILAKDNKGWSALTHAAFGGDEDSVKCLLDAGADPQTDLALVCAAFCGHTVAVRALMDKGADLEMFGPNQSTALMCAAGGGELGVVAMLLGAGAEVDALGRAGASALHYAASCGFQQVTRLLLDSGASATLLNKSGETPLSLIVKYGYGKCWSREKRLDGAEKVLRMLLKAGADVNRASRRRGETALLFLSDHQAKPLRDTVSTASDHSDQAGYDSSIDIPEIDPRSSDLQAMDILLQAGADPNQVDKAGNTALMRSSRSCELDKIQLLLANGANKDMVNNCGESALLIALKERRGLEVVKELLVAGADPSQELGGGNSVLSELISRNGIPHSDSELDEVLETIIAAGADLKTFHENGDTLLLQAARSGSLAIKALLAAGADLQASDNHGRNAIMLASMLDFDQGAEAVHLLLDAGVDPHRRDCNGDTALMLAAKSHYSPITLRNLLGSGLDADERDINGSTALMSVAYRSGDRESEARICALIEAGVSLDAADKKGNTALIIAAEHGYSIRALLDAGADPNAANKYGETALMKCFSHPRRVFEKVQALLDAGAHVNVLDGHRRDALMWAALRQELSEDVDAVKLLLSSGISLEHEDENGDTALACAERTSNTQTANWIRKEIRKRAKGGVVKQDKETVQGSQNTEGVTEKSPADSVAHMVAD